MGCDVCRGERERESGRVSFDEKEYLKTHGEREREREKRVVVGSKIRFVVAFC